MQAELAAGRAKHGYTMPTQLRLQCACLGHEGRGRHLAGMRRHDVRRLAPQRPQQQTCSRRAGQGGGVKLPCCKPRHAEAIVAPCGSKQASKQVFATQSAPAT